MNIRHFFCASLTLASVLFAAGCTTLTPRGMIAASQLDPLNTPPSQISVAIGVPLALRLGDGDANLRMAFTGGTETTPIALEENAQLEIRPADVGGPSPSSPTEHVFVARIAMEDAAQVAKLQRTIRELRAGGIDGQGSLSISITGGCYSTARPEAIELSTWIRTSQDGDYVRLTRRADIAETAGEETARQILNALTPCEP